MLYAMVQLSVISTAINEPPDSPDEGDRYIVGPAPTEGWGGKENQLADFVDDAWMFLLPQPGWTARVQSAQSLYVCEYDDELQINWSAVQNNNSASDEVALFGINTVAHQTNRLAVKADACLFSYDTDDHHLIINKNADQDTASLLFQ